MLFAIFSDIHSNLEAFTAVCQALLQYKIDRVYCVGDLVGYGANPNECIKILRSLNPYVVAGNHDWGAVSLTDIKYFNRYAQEAILWSKEAIDMDTRGFLSGLALLRQDDYIFMVHGSPYNPPEFNYVTDNLSAKLAFENMHTKLCFIGHSHVPEVIMDSNGVIDFLYGHKIYLDKNLKYIVNVGSIGQPRDGDPRSCLALFNTEECSIEFQRVRYDIESAQEKIIKAGLPMLFADRLAVGR